MTRPKPVVLTILDGWGAHDSPKHNAIAQASTPCMDRLQAEFPYGLLNASELHVGLPEAQMGNSEVGHMNIGAGRVVMQDLPRIDAAIDDGSLAENAQLVAFMETLKAGGGDCHLMGLLSDGGVHAHQNHIAALANIVADAGINVWVHAFLDGRDTPPKSAQDFIAECEKQLPENAKIATLTGRYWAMDRDARWERVSKAYDVLTQAKGSAFSDAGDYIESQYHADITDEFIETAAHKNYTGMKDGDGLLMANFRTDRAREILTALTDPTFDGFARTRVVNFAATAGMVEYSTKLAPLIPALFAPEQVTQIFGEIVSKAKLKQLRIAETEKYAHVTFFFNAGREEPFEGEERILVPSPKVATYDLQPEMSAPEVTDKLVEAIESDAFDVIVVNYANTDMVGHTGDIDAAIKAVETVDACVARVSDAVLAKDGAMFITADHGNAEVMHDDKTQQPHTAHTLNLVPAMLVHASLKGTTLGQQKHGKLADIAPTLLEWLGIEKPRVMTGTSLLSSCKPY